MPEPSLEIFIFNNQPGPAELPKSITISGNFAIAVTIRDFANQNIRSRVDTVGFNGYEAIEMFHALAEGLAIELKKYER